jgi:hypothetical protein
VLVQLRQVAPQNIKEGRMGKSCVLFLFSLRINKAGDMSTIFIDKDDFNADVGAKKNGRVT